MVFHNSSGKIIGALDNGHFSKKIKGSHHFLRKPKALCLDIGVVEELVENDVTDISILDTEENIWYTTTVEDFVNNSFLVDRGHGKQLGMALFKWNKVV